MITKRDSINSQVELVQRSEGSCSVSRPILWVEHILLFLLKLIVAVTSKLKRDAKLSKLC